METRCTGQLDAFDKRVEEVVKQFTEQAAAIDMARTAATTAFAAERSAMLERGNADIESATKAVTAAQNAVASVQKTQTAKCGPPAATGAAPVQGDTSPAVALSVQELADAQHVAEQRKTMEKQIATQTSKASQLEQQHRRRSQRCSRHQLVRRPSKSPST